MHANFAKATTTTTGTGNLTIAAVTGFPAPADKFALNQPFTYVLLDSNSRPLEAGVGYLSGSTTLVRAIIEDTFASSTDNNETATAASLTGTTTVLLTPIESSLEAILATVDGQTAGVNRFVTSAHRVLPAATQALVALRCYYAPFLLRCGGAVQSLSINVTTLASANARAAIYACNHLGYPGAKLCEVPSNLDVSTTGVKTGTLSSALRLPPGWYFAAMASDGTPTVTAYSSSQTATMGGAPFGFASGSVTPVDYRYETLGSLSMPSSASTSTTGSNMGGPHVPCVFVGVA